MMQPHGGPALDHAPPLPLTKPLAERPLPGAAPGTAALAAQPAAVGAAPAAAPAEALARCEEPFDVEYMRALESKVLSPLIAHYFRARLVNRERIPERGPVILASNHSGNCLPYDAVVLDAHMWALDGLDPAKKLRTVFEKELTLYWWLRMFGVDDIYRRGGGVDMTFDNFDRLLRDGERVLYFPEGVPGIGKGFQNRYRLRPFHTSFVTIGMRQGVPVLPMHIVNAEWLMPFHITIPWLDWGMQRIFRVPFLPLPLGILACLWPFLWFAFVLPARLTYVVGEPLDLREIGAAAGVRDVTEPTREEATRVAALVQERMQRELTEHVATYGQRVYDFRSLWRHLRRAPKLFGRVLPTGWPLAFHRVDRDRQRPPARNALHAALRDWDLFLYYVPLGWPLLTLARRLRKPPYGYRGLTRAAAREKRGERVWRLCERPLPPRAVRFGG